MSLDEVEILLIEDNDEDAELTTRALRKHKLTNRMHRIDDGAEALDYLYRRGAHADRPGGAPCVVLLDLKMPKVDGLEVLHAIKADPRLRMTPVVMLTSSREETDLVRSYALGVNGYVVKPVDFADFVEAVRQVGAFWALVNEAPPADAGSL